MQFSFFLKTFQCDEQSDHVILFSTKKASIIRISKEKYREIENGQIEPGEEKLLRELEILVDNREDEKKSITGFIDHINTIKKELDLTIVTSLDCNFACTYCLEGKMKGKHYLTEETAGDLESFIKQNLTSEKEALHLDFYGGEPLLSYGFIKSFARKMKSYTEDQDKRFTFTMITNGSLFTRKVATELSELGLTHIQTTLDGTAKTHNKTRPFTSGKGSFDIIIKNMKETWDLVKISTGGNYEKHNYKEYLELIDYLVTNDLGPEKIHQVRFAPVMRPMRDYPGGCTRISEDWIIEADLLLREELLKHGFSVRPPQPLACSIEHNNIFVVNYNGEIYKCSPFIGDTNFVVGDLKNGVKDYTEAYNVGYWKNAKCLNCEYLPLCFGGCRYLSFVREGDLKSLDCQKPYLDAILEPYIKMDIKYGNI